MDSTTSPRPDDESRASTSGGMDARGRDGSGSQRFSAVPRLERLGRMGTGAKVGVATAAAAGLLFGGFGLTTALAAEQGATTTVPTQSETPTSPGEQPAPGTEDAPRDGGAGPGAGDCPEPGTREETSEGTTESSAAATATSA